MSLVTAADADPQHIYRCTHHDVQGVYVLRVPRDAATRLMRRLRSGNPGTMTPRDAWLRRELPRLESGEAILFRRFMRGTSASTGHRYELKTLVAVAADYEFREVKRRPGY